MNHLQKFENMKNADWREFNQDNHETYPPEGEDVLISGVDANGQVVYDVAWYLMSSDYEWRKTYINLDKSKLFKGFTPLKWKFIS